MHDGSVMNEKRQGCSWCNDTGEVGPPEDKYVCPCPAGELLGARSVMARQSATIETLNRVLVRCRTILGNMARERPRSFRTIVLNDRWPINHEPLRADAKALLSVIDATLNPNQKVHLATDRCCIGSDLYGPKFHSMDCAKEHVGQANKTSNE